MENKPSLINKIISDYEYAISRIVLFCLTELPFPLGIEKTVSVLRGVKSTFVINNELNKLETFSVLSSFSKDELSIIIDILIQIELIEIENVSDFENMPVLKLSTKGKSYLKGEISSRIVILDQFIDKTVPEFDDLENSLFDNLRALRLTFSREKDLPAFTICHDKVLREICIHKPMNEEQLLEIKGIGSSFIEKYGDDFLEMIKDTYSKNDL